MKNYRFILILISIILLEYLLKEVLWNSRASIFTQSPKAGDYLGYAILFLLPASLAFYLLEAKNPVINKFDEVLSSSLSRLYVWCTGLEALPIAIVIFWIVNLIDNGFFGNVTTGDFPFDPLHEGDRLAYLATFLNSDKPFFEINVNVGYGVSVLPVMLATKLVGAPHVLMATRFLYTAQSLLAWLGCLWILLEISKFASPDKEIQRVVFAISSAVFMMGGASIAAGSAFFTVEVIQAFIIFQLALLIRMFRKACFFSANNWWTRGEAFVVGLSTSLGIFHSVKYGMLFPMVAIVAGFLSFAFGKQFAIICWGWGAVGMAVGSALILFILGPAQLAAFIESALYWPKNWNNHLSIPLFDGANRHYFWILQVLILIQILTLIYFWQAYRNSTRIKDFFRENAFLGLVFALSILFSKFALDRSDKYHFRQAAMPATFLLTLLAISWMKLLDKNLSAVTAFFYRHKPMITVVLIGFLALNMHPKEAAKNIKPYYKKYNLSDDQLIRADYAEAIRIMMPEVQSSSCFTSMTPEGVWHYFFKKPSCTKILYMLGIISENGQMEAIKELEEKKPGIILYTNESMRPGAKSWFTPETAPLMYDYIHKHYQPYKTIHSHVFWKRI